MSSLAQGSSPVPMFRRMFTFLFVGALVAAGCGGAQHPGDPGPRGTLRISGEPGDAFLEVDETRLGPISMFREKGMLLKPGVHRIVVTREGYFPLFRLVEIIQDRVIIEEIKLRPIPE